MSASSARLRAFLFVLLMLASTVRPAPAQSQEVQAPGYHLNAGTRVVLTDVTVTDAKGHHVGNLRAQDFAITDDGKPQTLTSFVEHKADPAPAQPSTATSPGTFDNAVLVHPPPVVNVLLIDIKNLEVVDQLYLLFQLSRLLNNLPANEPVAVFWCRGPETILLQSFTADHALLIAAVHKAIPRFPPTGNIFYDDFNTLHQLAASLAQMPGRKNILWFTGGSTQLLASPDGITHLAYGEAEIQRRVYDELEAGRLTLYPIDVRALLTGGFTKDSLWAQHEQMNEIAFQTGGKAFFNNNGLEQMAADILNADAGFYTLTYSPQDFHPDGKWHNVAVRLTLPQGTFQLSYRRGYFAETNSERNTNGGGGDADSRRALFTLKGDKAQDPDVRSAPILFAVQPMPSGQNAATSAVVTLPPDTALGKHGTATYTLRYTLPLDAFTVQQDAAGHARAQLGIAVMVFNDAGFIASRHAQEVTLSLRKDKLPLPPNAKVTVDQQIALPTGNTSLTCAVWDIGTHRLGTVQIPLDVHR